MLSRRIGETNRDAERVQGRDASVGVLRSLSTLPVVVGLSTTKRPRIAAWPNFRNQNNLRCALRPPVTEANEFLDLPTLVAVLLCLDRPVVGFSEGVFGVTYDFCDQVQRFGHNYVFLSQLAVA